MPVLDHERVYQSDLKKLVQWYNLLVGKGAFPLEAPDKPENEGDSGEKGKEEKPAAKKAPAKKASAKKAGAKKPAKKKDA